MDSEQSNDFMTAKKELVQKEKKWGKGGGGEERRTRAGGRGGEKGREKARDDLKKTRLPLPALRQ